MIALDTNVLLRALVEDADAKAQCAAARRLVTEAGEVAISAVVFLETMWTLSRSFGYSRAQVAQVGAMLLEHPKYHVRAIELFVPAIKRYADSTIDFADAVALEDAISHGDQIHTFDRKFARLDGAHAVRV